MYRMRQIHIHTKQNHQIQLVYLSLTFSKSPWGVAISIEIDFSGSYAQYECIFIRREKKICKAIPTTTHLPHHSYFIIALWTFCENDKQNHCTECAVQYVHSVYRNRCVYMALKWYNRFPSHTHTNTSAQTYFAPFSFPLGAFILPIWGGGGCLVFMLHAQSHSSIQWFLMTHIMPDLNFT